MNDSTLVGALTLNIPTNQETEPYDVQVICRAFDSQGNDEQISTNFTVYSG